MIRTTVNGVHVEIYQPHDASEFLGVSVRKLTSLRNDGWVLPLTWAGNQYVYTKDALIECKEYLDRQNTNVEVRKVWQ